MIDANEAIQRVETVLKNAGINASKAQIWQVAHELLSMVNETVRDERIAINAIAKLRGRL